MSFRMLGFAGALACATWASAVRADDGGTAQALFDKAVSDLEGGRPESACPAFAESQRLDPRPGTLFALADCEVALERIASALGHYHEYLGWVSRLASDQQERHAERVESARAQVEALQHKVPTLTLALSATAPKGTLVERDGVALGPAALGVALPIDPGEHVVVSRAPGVPEERLTVTLGFGDSKTLELPYRPAPPPVSAPPPAPAITEKTALPPAPPDDGSAFGQRSWGYVVGGVGVAGLVVGSVTGLLALDRKKTVDEECRPDHDSCTKAGLDAVDSGKTLAAVSTVAFAVGLAGIATGVTLVLTAPDEKGRSSAYLGASGRF